MRPGLLIADRYELRAYAGAGGFGEVWRASDRDSDGEVEVAIKFLRRQRRMDSARFDREIRILRDLTHPGIVSLLDHGMFGDVGFLVMPWLDGETLHARLKAGPLDVEDVRVLAIRVTESLVAAHRAGVVHRDLKPENIFLLEKDVSAPYLLDFGLARIPMTNLTRTGVALGTPGYIAPEQARGNKDVDARADLYSLGCILFKCVSGRPLFEEAQPIVAMLKAAYEPPRRLKKIWAETPDYLDELVHQLVAGSPEMRPESAEIVLDALERREAPAPRSTIELEKPQQVFAVGRPIEGATLENLDDEAFQAQEKKANAAVLHEGARMEHLADGTVLLFPDPQRTPVEQLRALARCVIKLRTIFGDTAFGLVGDPSVTASTDSGFAKLGAALLTALDEPLIVVDERCVSALEDDFDLTETEGGQILLGPRAPGPVFAKPAALGIGTSLSPEASAPRDKAREKDSEPPVISLPIPAAPRIEPRPSWNWTSFVVGMLTASVLIAAAVVALSSR